MGHLLEMKLSSNTSQFPISALPIGSFKEYKDKCKYWSFVKRDQIVIQMYDLKTIVFKQSRNLQISILSLDYC